MMSAEQAGTATARRSGAGVAAFLGLVLFYQITAPANHAISIDPYFYARMIAEDSLGSVPHPRLMLWIFAMQGLYQSVAHFVPALDPFRVIGLLNAVLTAGAVLLLVRVLRRDFLLDPASAWLTAALFATAYGIWRYATEIEVYAASSLLSLLLVHMTFALGRGARPARDVAMLGLIGGLVTLVYQPIGILSAGVVPLYLLLAGRWRHVPLYGLIAGGIVVTGFGIGAMLGNHDTSKAAVNFVFQTHELFPKLPTPMTAIAMAYGLGSDLLSANWLLAFEPLREVFGRVSPEAILDEELYAATRAGWLAIVPLVTLPALAVLTGLAALTAARGGARRVRAREAVMILWFLLHAAMMGILSPSGFEGWLLAVVPLSVVIGVFLVQPCVAAGRERLVQLLLVVFVIHNGLAGIAIQFSPSGDYFRARTDAVLQRTGPGDLIVIATNWNLNQYLNYRAAAQVIRVDDAGVDATRAAIEETLARQGNVVVLDDVAHPSATLLAAQPGIEAGLATLAQDYLAGAERFPTADAGWAYELAR